VKAEMEAAVLMAEVQSEIVLNKGIKHRVLHFTSYQQEIYFTGDQDDTSEVWYLDNGASNHMTRDRHKFIELDENFTGKVRFGDGSVVDIQGIGCIVFQWKTGVQWVLRDVYYIPRLKTSLISLGQLTEIGHRVVMEGEEIVVSEKNPYRVIMCDQRTANRLYKIELNPVKPVCLLTSFEDQG
jgi:hypothetical protein